MGEMKIDESPKDTKGDDQWESLRLINERLTQLEETVKTLTMSNNQLTENQETLLDELEAREAKLSEARAEVDSSNNPLFLPFKKTIQRLLG